MTSQFDVVVNLHAPSKRSFPHLLLLQHDFLDGLKSVVVAPVHPAKGSAAITKISVELDINGVPHCAALHLLTAMDRNVLGRKVANAMDHRDAIIRAYDIIISGI